MQFQLNEWYEITAAYGTPGERDLVVKNLTGRVVDINDRGVTVTIPGHGDVGLRHDGIIEARCTSLDEVAV